MPENFSEENLVQASQSISSLISKCEKSLEKITGRTSQRTLLQNRISALKIALRLIEKELNDKTNSR
jgi:hypothetical protein